MTYNKRIIRILSLFICAVFLYSNISWCSQDFGVLRGLSFIEKKKPQVDGAKIIEEIFTSYPAAAAANRALLAAYKVTPEEIEIDRSNINEERAKRVQEGALVATARFIKFPESLGATRSAQDAPNRARFIQAGKNTEALSKIGIVIGASGEGGRLLGELVKRGLISAEKAQELTKPTIPVTQIQEYSPLYIQLRIIASICEDFGIDMPVCVAMSPLEANKPLLEKFLRENNNFGIKNLKVVIQGVNVTYKPAEDKIATKANGSVIFKPNGIAGIFDELKLSGGLDWFRGALGKGGRLLYLNGDNSLDEDLVYLIAGAAMLHNEMSFINFTYSSPETAPYGVPCIVEREGKISCEIIEKAQRYEVTGLQEKCTEGKIINANGNIMLMSLDEDMEKRIEQVNAAKHALLDKKAYGLGVAREGEIGEVSVDHIEEWVVDFPRFYPAERVLSVDVDDIYRGIKNPDVLKDIRAEAVKANLEIAAQLGITVEPGGAIEFEPGLDPSKIKVGNGCIVRTGARFFIGTDNVEIGNDVEVENGTVKITGKGLVKVKDNTKFSIGTLELVLTEQGRVVIDGVTGLEAGRPDVKPFTADVDPAAVHTKVKNRLDMRTHITVLSFAGFREIFDASLHDEINNLTRVDPDGETDDRWEGMGTTLTDAAKVHIGTMAQHFVKTAKERTGKQRPVINIALDSRHTGPAIADIIIRMLLHEDVDINISFITSIPEMMVWSKEKMPDGTRADGWMYISASHNPRGHNGLKLGLTVKLDDGTYDTKIIPEDWGAPFREELIGALGDEKNTEDIIKALYSIDNQRVAKILFKIPECRSRSNEVYASFSDLVAAGMKDVAPAAQFKKERAEQIRNMNLAVALDPNGGARIKEEAAYWKTWGFDTVEVHGKARDMAGLLAPTQASMEELGKLMSAHNAAELEKAGKDPAYKPKIMEIGIRFDTDGDRRNLIFWDKRTNQPVAPGVQLCYVMDAISKLMQKGVVEKLDPTKPEAERKVVVVANDPSSTILEILKDVLGFKLRVAEVGEANVTKAGEEEAASGKTVAIIGEASNGGAFTLQLKVREPRLSLGTIVNFLTDKELVKRFLEKVGRSDAYVEDFTMADLVKVLWETFPSDTTDFFTPKGEGDRREAIAVPFGLYKDTFSEHARTIWAQQVIERLKKEYPEGGWRYDIANFEMEHRLTEAERGTYRPNHAGGYRVEFYYKDQTGKERLVNWAWFRPSATEAGVLRRGVSPAHWRNWGGALEQVQRLRKELDTMLTQAMDYVELQSARAFLLNYGQYLALAADQDMQKLRQEETKNFFDSLARKYEHGGEGKQQVLGLLAGLPLEARAGIVQRLAEQHQVIVQEFAPQGGGVGVLTNVDNNISVMI